MKKIKHTIYIFLNRLFPRLDKVLVYGNRKGECNAVEVANFMSKQYDFPVFYVVDQNFGPYVKQVLDSNIRLIQTKSVSFIYHLITSKYIFSTHGFMPLVSAKDQITVNIWHGLLYKNIRKLRGDKALHADVTVGTSPLSQKMFSEAFGVSKESVLVSGYPRNDMMLRAQTEKKALKGQIAPDLTNYDKTVFWMPTFRRKSEEDMPVDLSKLKLENPFEISNFDVAAFNELLKSQNTLCLLKPHYIYIKNNDFPKYSHIKMIDDQWIMNQGLTLYQLLACTDILISDFSSVMFDYTLLNKPIICFCKDLEEYKKTQGLYFEKIEDWLPSALIQDQQHFFKYLKQVLTTNKDPYIEKREKIKKLSFTYTDADSSKRICEYVFGEKL